MQKQKIIKPVTGAMFLAIGLVLPFLTGQIPQIGKMLLPMHLPVILCGFICGPYYGLLVGFILPLVRSFIFSMPVMYPAAIAMAFELGAYGFLTGFLFTRARWQCMKSLYRCLILSMLGGRIVWGVATAVLMGVGGEAFTLSAFLSGAFLTSIPGIILQLVAVPAVMLALNKTHFVHFKRKMVNEN